MTAVRPLVVLSTVLTAAVILADDPPKPPVAVTPKPTAAEIAEAVRLIGGGRFTAREKAQQTLWRAGAAAEPALRAALNSADPEVVRRARAVLDKFEWGIYPDTPPAVLAMIERFRDGDEDAKRQVVGDLIRLGAQGITTLARFVIRTDLLDLLGEGEEAISNYVALAHFSGALPDVIGRWEAAAKAGKAERAGDVLAALYRAKGDYAAARKHAAENPDLLHDLIWEQGDWKALADLPAGPNAGTAGAIAARAVCFRLAGDVKAAADEIAALKKLDDADEWTVVRSLLLAGEPLDPAERLRKSRTAEVFDLHVAQLRYKEAFAVADAAGEDDALPGLTFRRARALYLLGDKDRAGQLFAKVASGPAEVEDVVKLVRTEYGFGLKAAAREHAAGYLGILAQQVVNPQRLDQDPARTVLDAVFPKHGADAKVWWTFLRQKFPQNDAAATMKRVVELLDPPTAERRGLSPPSERRGQAPPLADDLVAAQDDAIQIAAARQALATAYEVAGQFDAARDQLAKAAEADEAGAAAAGIKLGDFHLNRRQFTEAAAAYGEAWKRDKSQALPLALQGWALTKVGRADEGKALLDQAHVLPLGATHVRIDLAEELAKRDAVEPARRERDLVMKLGWAKSWPASNFLVHLGRDAAARKDFATAAGAYERIVLGVLATEINFLETSAYLAVPALARTYRARASLTAGQVDEALAHARASLDLMPGHMDVALLLVPELDKRGRKADADALYQRAAGPYVTLAKDYPQSGHAHNAVAWLGAYCHRDLDAALDHARKATAAEPKQAGYRDTLAEVHFQRGETDVAIKLMRECIAMDPRKAYFGKQLKRFEAGDRTVPPPDEEEE